MALAALFRRSSRTSSVRILWQTRSVICNGGPGSQELADLCFKHEAGAAWARIGLPCAHLGRRHFSITGGTAAEVASSEREAATLTDVNDILLAETPDHSGDAVDLPADPALDAAADAHADRMRALDARRKKSPFRQVENLEQWLASKGDALEPFKAFLRKHGVDADKAVAALFASGYSARRVMFAKSSPQGKGALRPLGHGTDMEGEAEAPSAVAAAAPWEASFAAWSEVLRAEDLPHSFPDLLGRCTALLARDPAKAPATIATLRETLLNDDMLHQLIGQTPRMLGEDPLALQRRLVTLQVACAGDLHPLLQREPKLLSTKLDDVLANIRLLREHCRSQDDFRELVLLRPDLLVYRPRHLAGMVAAVKRALSSALGESIDPLAIVRCRPQLMTIPHPALTKRWSSLTQIASTVPQWQEELDSMLQDAALAPKPATSAEPASAPPAWVGLAPDQVPVGVKLDPPANPQETAEGQDVVDSEQEAPGEWGCESIADALYVPPMKYSRLRYLAEVMPDKAGDISFLDGMLVGWKRFARRFPEFDAWVKEREESKSREQRQTGTEAEEPAGQMNQAESSSNETQ